MTVTVSCPLEGVIVADNHNTITAGVYVEFSVLHP
jgi:hypothetical protein